MKHVISFFILMVILSFVLGYYTHAKYATVVENKVLNMTHLDISNMFAQ